MFKNIQVVVFSTLLFFVGACGVRETYVPYGSGGYKCHEKTDVKTLKFQREDSIGSKEIMAKTVEIRLDPEIAIIPLSTSNLIRLKKQVVKEIEVAQCLKYPISKAKKEPLSLEKRALRNANLSLIFSLLGIAGIPILLTLLFGPLAIYTGYRAKAQGLKGKGSGRANWGIALGIIFTAFVGLFIYLADIGAFSWM
jgi:hypothetical protein